MIESCALNSYYGFYQKKVENGFYKFESNAKILQKVLFIKPNITSPKEDSGCLWDLRK